MTITAAIAERRTSADIVFDELYDQIMSLKLLPGSKISEAEIADRYGVSRQPVREAFNRLSTRGLLLIQPQRATRIQQFSMEAIDTARFIRAALEIEIVRTACKHWRPALESRFKRNLSDQRKAAMTENASDFREHDEIFHALLAETANQESVFPLVMEQKAQVDRICVLSLKEAHEMSVLVEDHENILNAVREGDVAAAELALRSHLSRINKTITAVHGAHEDYFSD